MPLLLAGFVESTAHNSFGQALRVGTGESHVLVLADAQAATAALDGARVQLAGKVANGKSEPAAVGSGGTVLTGTSPDASKSVTILSFAECNTATTVEFDGTPKDPVPPDLVLELGQKQDTAIKDWQAA
jgi:hypothetical protein